MMQIRDPIHGYISLDGMYADIVNTPEFQRLRSIEQGSFRPVFPGARHDRFLHSLGTYHLAVKFADHFFRNLYEDLGIRAADEDVLKTTFCYAALLHDIGHAPFSHTTEKFFAAKKIPGTNVPQIWQDLGYAVDAVNPSEGQLFLSSASVFGAPHEIASSIVLVNNLNSLTSHKDRALVDLALAARMVIGFTYNPGDLDMTEDKRGVRNCLIRLLNADILDVDRLDYLGRDTQMSGYVNAPLDLECLAASVTAVQLPNGLLSPAFRDSALRVFDLMFQAKLSHDTWVLASPAGPYDAELKAHCIRQCYGSNMNRIFSVDSLSRLGHVLNGKTYRLLSDVDVEADLKACTGGTFDELYTRELGGRRIAAWRSYYEYHHLFGTIKPGKPEAVYKFFKPLIKYLQKKDIFVFNEQAYQQITGCGDPDVIKAANFLRDYLMGLAPNPEMATEYNVVLLDQSVNFAIKKVNPENIYITFPKLKKFTRTDKKNYSTYAELTGVQPNPGPGSNSANPYARTYDYFYLYRHNGLGYKQLTTLRDELAKII